MNENLTRPYEIINPEVVLNLWAYSDEYGYVQRLAGKAYILDGDDGQKLSLLRQLSMTDFMSAKWFHVPSNFNLNDPDGKDLKGVAHASLISDPYTNGVLFREVMDSIAHHLPEQLRLIGEDYQRYLLELPESPLCVTTLVIEKQDGRLVPMISQE